MGIRIKQTLKKEGEMTLEERSRILDEIQATSLGVNVTPVPSSAGATHPIQMMSAMCLCIRSWVRHHHSLLDLKVFYTPSQTFLTYFFQMDDQGFKIEFPIAWINSLDLFRAHKDLHIPFEGMLAVTLSRPPLFSVSEGTERIPSGDFTEHAAATHTLTHCIFGSLQDLEYETKLLFQHLEFRSTCRGDCRACHTAAEPRFTDYDWAAYMCLDVSKSRSHSSPLSTTQ